MESHYFQTYQLDPMAFIPSRQIENPVYNINYQKEQKPSISDVHHNVPPATIKPRTEFVCSKNYPKGYRFMPTDEELITYYLKERINNKPIPVEEICDADLYQYNPPTLTANYPTLGKDTWYFFTPRDRKYPNGSRPNRAAGSGYWKATGADKVIQNDNEENIGFRKALVFYEGRPPKGVKTDWYMHEFKVNMPTRSKMDAHDMRLDDWVLCRVYYKPSHPEKGQAKIVNPNPDPKKVKTSPNPSKRKSKKVKTNPVHDQCHANVVPEGNNTTPFSDYYINYNNLEEGIKQEDTEGVNHPGGLIENQLATGQYVTQSMEEQSSLVNNNLQSNIGTQTMLDEPDPVGSFLQNINDLLTMEDICFGPTNFGLSFLDEKSEDVHLNVLPNCNNDNKFIKRKRRMWGDEDL